MFSNILVTIDLEKDVEATFNYVKALAKKFDAKVWVLHIAAPEPDFVGYGVGPQSVRDYRARELREEHQQIQMLRDELINEGVNAEGLLIDGATVESVVSECKKLNVDLICIGHHHHDWFQRIFEGHTDFSIISRVKIPVMVIPVE